jgi:fructokinase
MANVLTILSTLGWSATPIAKIGNDHPGRIVREDLTSFDVNCTFIDVDAATPTPIWIEYFDRIGANGVPSHYYERTCPICGGRLPSFTPPPTELLTSAHSALASADIIFVDRVSPEIVACSAEAGRQGAIVMYEPGLVPALTESMVAMTAIANILKYPDDSFPILGTLPVRDGTVVIHTRGESGLRFRVAPGDWISQDPSPTSRRVDVAGCGDWLSAGTLHVLFERHQARRISALIPGLDDALRRGQTLAAWSCAFAGARGGMYDADFDLIVPAWGTKRRDTFGPTRPHVSIDSKLICATCRAH